MSKPKKQPALIILFIILFMVLVGLVVLLVIRPGNEHLSSESDSLAELDDTGIDWTNYETHHITLSDTYHITQSGVYQLTGEIKDGNITIDTDENVKLILDNVSINNSDGPAIFVKNAKNVVISTTEDSTNTLTDGATYAGYELDEVGTIFSHDDLFLDGKGTLTIISNNEDAIVTKDDLVILDGNYNITAADDAIRGKDSVEIKAGNFEIASTGAGIKSTNDTEDTKGYIDISGGTFKINAIDDALHASGDLTISGGTFTLSSGDDAMHTDKNLVIQNGTIDIAKSYEGLEGSTVTINGGEISIVASDDGINAAGGNDASGFARPGADQFRSNSEYYIRIAGGKITVDASGDGIDSNGNIFIDGGEMIVYGPTDDGNGALDYDGELKMTGGVLVAGGPSGMVQGISTNSTIYSVMIFFGNNYKANTAITIEGENGTEIANYIARKAFSSLVVASSQLEKDQTYTIKIDGETYQTFTTSSISTQVGNGGFGGNMMQAGPGGAIPTGGMSGEKTRR